MKTVTTLSLLLTCVFYGCAGVNIKPISCEEAENAHNGSSSKIKGYIVYEPMIVVQITKNDSGIGYKAGAPFLLPDYNKPYVIEMEKSATAKSGMEYTIEDGWRLGSVKDNTDNTAALDGIASIISSVAGMEIMKSWGLGSYDATKDKSGLYRVILNKDTHKVDLEPIMLYAE